MKGCGGKEQPDCPAVMPTCRGLFKSVNLLPTLSPPGKAVVMEATFPDRSHKR